MRPFGFSPIPQFHLHVENLTTHAVYVKTLTIKHSTAIKINVLNVFSVLVKCCVQTIYAEYHFSDSMLVHLESAYSLGWGWMRFGDMVAGSFWYFYDT